MYEAMHMGMTKQIIIAYPFVTINLWNDSQFVNLEISKQEE
jgi:hypothetical protein